MSIKLTELEKQSAVWVKLKKLLTERLDDHRRKNDANLGECDTAKLRGRIAELKFLLDLETPDPAPIEAADNTPAS